MQSTFDRIIEHSPFIKLLPPCMVGIIAYNYLSSQLANYLSLTVGILALWLISFARKIPDFYKYKIKWIKGACVVCFYVSLGYWLSYSHDTNHASDSYKNADSTSTHAIVRLLDYPLDKDKTYKLHVEVSELLNTKYAYQTQGEAFIYLKKDTPIRYLSVGDYLMIRNKFKPIAQPLNPGAFDYKAYAKRNNIFESAYLNNNEWVQLKKKKTDFNYACKSLNLKVRNLLALNLHDKNVLALSEALLIGYRSNIDEEITQLFTNTGIVHIIAISGMHIMIVYYSILFLLARIPFFMKRLKMKYLIALLCIWLFASLTGLPASVTRAACMISLLALGKLVNRDISVYNNLAASAFILLCFQPMWLFDVGFQLSYAAVLGILICYPPLANLLFVKYKFLNKVSQLCALNIAAQVFTLPLCLYYFHQFPTLFLVANLIAIPLSTLTLYAVFALLILSPFELLAKWVVILINQLVHLLIKCMQMASSWHYAIIDGIQLSFSAMLIMYGIIVCLVVWLMLKSTRWLRWTASLLIAFLCISNFNEYRHCKQNYFMVLHTYRSSCLSFVTGKSVRFMMSDSLVHDKKFNQYILKPFITSLRIETKYFLTQVPEAPLSIYRFGFKRIVHLRNSNFTAAQPIQTNVLICSNQVNPDSIWFQKHINTSLVVLDGSVAKWQSRRWKDLAKRLKLQLHDVNEEGPYVYKF